MGALKVGHLSEDLEKLLLLNVNAVLCNLGVRDA